MKLPLATLAAALTATAALAAPIAPTIKGDLVSVSASGKRVGKFDDAPLANAKYFAVYYSAEWCGPCKAFTPKLVSWYNTNKPKHPNFELIFVSSDRDEASMENYMTEDKMPWPALKFSKIKNTKSLTQYKGSGIPCLVFVDADGKVLSHSYEGNRYVGPNKVLADIDKTLGSGDPSAAAAEPAGAAAPAGTAKPASPSGSNFDSFFKKK